MITDTKTSSNDDGNGEQAVTSITSSAAVADDALRYLGVEWGESLSAGNRSKGTRGIYRDALVDLDRWLGSQGMPRTAQGVRREHLEAYFARLSERLKPATVSLRWRALQQFWKWALSQELVERSPMDRMARPIVPETPVPILRYEALDRLLKACSGRDFADKRDLAIVQMFIRTGMRRGELASLRVEDVFESDKDGSPGAVRETIWITGKGRKQRPQVLAPEVRDALYKFRRSRRLHRLAHRPELWLGAAGVMTDNGIYQVIRGRAERAGLGKVHPHQLRHTFADEWLRNGGDAGALMRMMGWSSRAMADRYGAAAATDRALEASRNLNLFASLGRRR